MRTSLSLSRSLSLSLSRALSLSPSLSHSRAFSLSLSLSLSRARSLSHARTHQSYTHTLTHTNRQSNCGTNLRPSRTQLSPLHALLRLQRLFFCLCFSCWGLIIPSLPVFLSFFITPRPALFSFFNPQRRKKNSRACFSSTPSGRNSEKSAPSPTSIPNWADVSEFLPSHAAPPINVLGHLPFRISAPSAAVHETFETRNPEP